jgi:hypothetical protein
MCPGNSEKNSQSFALRDGCFHLPYSLLFHLPESEYRGSCRAQLPCKAVQPWWSQDSVPFQVKGDRQLQRPSGFEVVYKAKTTRQQFTSHLTATWLSDQSLVATKDSIFSTPKTASTKFFSTSISLSHPFVISTASKTTHTSIVRLGCLLLSLRSPA